MTQHTKEFSARLSSAKAWREGIRPLIEQAFMFCAPGREHDFSARTKTTLETQVFSSLPEELATDLAGDLVSYFTPPEATWASYEVVTPIPKEEVAIVQEIVSEREKELFSLILQSNYNDIAPQWGFEAAVHGTPALWIDQGALMQPIHCEVVPPHELLVTPGHLGILDRFRETSVLSSSVQTLLLNYPTTYTPEMLERFKKPGLVSKVLWGFWLDWSDPNRPLWRCEIGVDGKRVTPEEPVTLGDIAGSCPLQVGRFNPQPGRPWGRGCGVKALPDMRTSDSVEDAILGGLEQSLFNTIFYPDDGVIDLSEGIQPGRAYPAGRGFDRNSIFEMNKSVSLDYGYYTQQAFELRLRAAFYQDGPRQTGDTPPTASQWLDERRRVQQRIGKPSAPLWTELIRPMIQRFEYLGVRTGKLPEALSHNERDILVTPISPLQKAQNNDRIMTARGNLDTIAAVAGEQLPQVVDLGATLRNFIRESGDTILVLKSQQNAPPPEA